MRPGEQRRCRSPATFLAALAFVGAMLHVDARDAPSALLAKTGAGVRKVDVGGLHNASQTGAANNMHAVQTVFPFNDRHVSTPEWLKYLSFTHLLKGTCIVSNLGWQASPMETMLEIRQKKHTGNLNPLPMITMMVSAGHWSFYAIFAWYMTGKTGFLTIFFANIVGFMLGLFYISFFEVNCRDEDMKKKTKFYYQCVVAITVSEIVAMIFRKAEQSLWLTGMMSAGCSMSVALSPFAGLPEVLRTRSVDGMPVVMIIAGFGGYCLWLLCGIVLSDSWIIYTNTFCSLASAAILLIIARLHPQTKHLFGDYSSQKCCAATEEAPLMKWASTPSPVHCGTGGTPDSPEAPEISN